jgi:hypothetical protein
MRVHQGAGVGTFHEKRAETVSQDTAGARRHGRVARAALVALAIPVALMLAACDGTDGYKAAASTAAPLPSGDTGSVQAAACPRIDSAWATFRAREKLLPPRYRPNYSAYETLSTALLDTLTGNRDYQFAEDVDTLASAADAVDSDRNRGPSTKADWLAFKTATYTIDWRCHASLVVPQL